VERVVAVEEHRCMSSGLARIMRNGLADVA
jgi:hypothetical protein